MAWETAPAVTCIHTKSATSALALPIPIAHGPRTRWIESDVRRIASATLEPGAVPKTSALGHNYPNPFNPTTQVLFELAEAGQVRLAIYDLEGREVAVLVDGPLAAGSHEVRGDANRMPAGLYLCRMPAGTVADVRKIVLLK